MFPEGFFLHKQSKKRGATIERNIYCEINMCSAECRLCKCCRELDYALIVRDCKIEKCRGISLKNIAGGYCKKCENAYCRWAGVLCCQEEWVLDGGFDARDRQSRQVIVVQSLRELTVHKAARAWKNKE